MIHILVVEDSVQDMAFYQVSLENVEDVQCHYAMCSEEALAIAKKEPIDIFLLDIELPDINGLELAQKIRELPSYSLALILFITGYAENQLEAFKLLHCYDYIVKPFHAAELREKILTLTQQLSMTKRKLASGKMIPYPSKDYEILIPVVTIRYATILKGACCVYTDLQEEPLISDLLGLAELIEIADDPFFLRCHKSFALNVRKIRRFESVNYRLWHIVLDNSTVLDVTKKFYAQVRKQFEQWMREQGE